MSDFPTGERFVPGFDGPGIHLEHLHRYCVAATLVENETLDLACGSGYGAQILARRCRHVMAIDRSTSAVHYARRHFSRCNLDHLVGGAEALPFRSGTFDTVVCFEIIEHVREYEQLLAEARRVLSKAGLLLVSTPNRLQYSEAMDYCNPFHTQEWLREEFIDLLRREFKHVCLWGQRLVAASRIWDDSSRRKPEALQSFTVDETLAPDFCVEPDPMYFFALCSNRALKRRETSAIASMFSGRLDAFLEEHKRLIEGYSAETAKRYEIEIGKLNGHIRHYQTQNEELQGGLAQLEEQLNEQRDLAVRGWAEVEAFHQTKIWKLAVALGWARSTLPRVLSIVARCLKALPQPLGWAYLLGALAFEGGRARLRRRRGPPTFSIPAPEATAGWRPRVLIVSPYPIYPPDHGGGVRLFNLVKRLSNACDLSLLIFIRSDDDPAQRAALEPYCRRIDFHHWEPSSRPDFWGLTPPNEQIFASQLATDRIREIVLSQSVDIVQLEYTELGQYARGLDNVRIIVTEHDIARRQHQRRRKLGFHRRFPEGRNFGSSYLDWVRISRYELEVCHLADQIHVMSEDDGEYLASHLKDRGSRIRVIPNGVDNAFYAPPDSAQPGDDILFAGNYQNIPNVDALEYFLADIWPIVRLRCPEVTLSVVGANPSPRVLRFDGLSGVTVVGPVEDLRRVYHTHRMMVAPLRVGSGTRLKILEAFASGLPVVSTTLGSEGLDCQTGKHLLLADAHVPFADAVTRLLTDDELCTTLSNNARRLTAEQFDWDLSAAKCRACYGEVLMGNDPKSDHTKARIGAERR